YGFTYEADKGALLEFKSKVSEGKRVVLSSWNNSIPLCNWVGVTCGRKHKRVTSLDLGGLKLDGVISPSIGNLSFLISLNLMDNSFGGTIPKEVGNLFRLEHLNMSFNSLGGGIPLNLFNCSRLLTLDLASNHLGKDAPLEIGSLKKLVVLELGENNLQGNLPASLGNLTSLRNLGFGNNNIQGGIPDDMAKRTQLETLSLSKNNLSGCFPSAIYNMSSLEYVSMFGDGFSGSLRPDLGSFLPNLRGIYMGRNYFTGAIPASFSNISTLQELTIEYNSMTGSVPLSFGKIRNFQFLALQGNSLGSNSSSKDLEFLGVMTNCTQLEYFDIGENRLSGDLPTSIANLSMNLLHLSLAANLISGRIPNDMGNLISLQKLRLDQNLLTGPIPTFIGKLKGLEVLSVFSNKMSGEIPYSIGNLTRLGQLYLYNNSFQGNVPPSLGNCRDLVYLHIGSNNMSRNSLSGSLPKDLGSLGNLVTLSFAYNQLSGQLPQSLGNCLSLEELSLQGNYFDGAIPDIRRLMGVIRVDFSNNNLSAICQTQGIFQNATIVSVFGNKNLCGGIKELKLKPCIVQAPPNPKHFSLLKKVVISIGVSIGIALLVFLFIIGLISLRWRMKRNKSQTSSFTLGAFHEKISYRDLQNATNGFSSSNLIGSGSFGTVFKALFPVENKVVAVKVLNLQKRGAMKSFMAECLSLKDIRHRNLVKLLTACSSIDFKGDEFRALIYKFMPNGSLDEWLHPEEVENQIRRPSRALTFRERLSIAIDVAFGLEYLHVHCHEPIAHCDLKPSNVLLDDDLTACVSDFGLSRLLLKFDQESFFNQLSSAGVRGTVGYAAPEYGIGGQPSIHGDVYSFGILLLEMFTGKRPTNELFGGNFTLLNYTKLGLPKRILDIADPSILHSNRECLKVVLEVGLRCCEESPTNRLAMSEVVSELILIKERYFKAIKTARR
ncbi:hypothetical protein EUTSA_v10017653mg, partial [Eutrema salsugineum]